MEDGCELLDIVDDKDNVIGTILRRDFENKTNSNRYLIRGSAALIVNSLGEIWVPERLHTRSADPGFWDFSIAEHVASRETYLEAAIRGFDEELNFNINPSKLEAVTKVAPSKTGPWFTTVFIYRSDVAPIEYRHEFYAARWMTLDELRCHINLGQKVRTGLVEFTKQIKFL